MHKDDGDVRERVGKCHLCGGHKALGGASLKWWSGEECDYSLPGLGHFTYDAKLGWGTHKARRRCMQEVHAGGAEGNTGSSCGSLPEFECLSCGSGGAKEDAPFHFIDRTCLFARGGPRLQSRWRRLIKSTRVRPSRKPGGEISIVVLFWLNPKAVKLINTLSAQCEDIHMNINQWGLFPYSRFPAPNHHRHNMFLTSRFSKNSNLLLKSDALYKRLAGERDLRRRACRICIFCPLSVSLSLSLYQEWMLKESKDERKRLTFPFLKWNDQHFPSFRKGLALFTAMPCAPSIYTELLIDNLWPPGGLKYIKHIWSCFDMHCYRLLNSASMALDLWWKSLLLISKKLSCCCTASLLKIPTCFSDYSINDDFLCITPQRRIGFWSEWSELSFWCCNAFRESVIFLVWRQFGAVGASWWHLLYISQPSCVYWECARVCMQFWIIFFDVCRVFLFTLKDKLIKNTQTQRVNQMKSKGIR